MGWQERVAAYLEELELVTTELAAQIRRVEVDQIPQAQTTVLSETRLNTSEAGVLDSGTQDLAGCLVELEDKVAQRELLLRAADAPDAGLTLAEKLLALGDQRSLALRDRCETIGELIADTNNRAVSLFVCQFHLANLTDEIVRVMAGVPEPKTYSTTTKQTALGGNIFNESV